MKKARFAYTVGWLAIAASAALLETIALKNKLRGDTLTEHLRKLVHSGRLVWFASLVAFAGFSVWFSRHIWWMKKI